MNTNNLDNVNLLTSITSSYIQENFKPTSDYSKNVQNWWFASRIGRRAYYWPSKYSEK